MIEVGAAIYLFAKVMTLVFVGLYIIFAFVVVKQVQLMNETIEVDFEKVISMMSFVHLIFAVVVFIFALFAL